MYGNGAGIGMIASITGAVREAIRVVLLWAPPVCCAVVPAASLTTHVVLIATATRLASALTASGACVLEVSQVGERSDKQARSGAAPVRREARAKDQEAVDVKNENRDNSNQPVQTHLFYLN